jgi:hypothetical protein
LRSGWKQDLRSLSDFQRGCLQQFTLRRKLAALSPGVSTIRRWIPAGPCPFAGNSALVFVGRAWETRGFW